MQVGETSKINNQIEIIQQDNIELHRAIKDARIKHEDLVKQVKYLTDEATKPVYLTYQVFQATAYSTYENGDKLSGRRWGGLTKTSTIPKQGRTIAVDPNVIPLGSKVYIIFPEPFSYMNGVYVAEDIGNAVNLNHIDVYFNSVQTCYTFGIKEIYVRIL